MTCLDCGAGHAVGVCFDCGAAVYRDHVVEVHRTPVAVINRRVPVSPPARELRLTVCHTAQLALSN